MTGWLLAEIQSQPLTLGIVVDVLLLCVGIALLVNWLNTTKMGLESLADAPPRRNRLPWFVPMAVFGAWVAVVNGLALLARDAAIGAGVSEAGVTAALYGTLAAGSIFFIAVMVWLAGQFFARGIRGFGLRWRGSGRDAGYALVYLMAIMPLVLGMYYLVEWLGTKYLPQFEMEKNDALVALLADGNAWVVVLIVVFVVAVVPVFEEMLFRGLFQTVLKNVLRHPWAAIVISSIIFAMLHPQTHWPALFMLSLALGYSYERSGSMLRPIFLHMFFNGSSVALALLAQRAAG